MTRLVSLLPALCLSSCFVISPTAKIVGKAATTTISVAGKAAGAGIDAMRKNPESDSESAE